MRRHNIIPIDVTSSKEQAEEAEKLCLEAQGNNTKDSIKHDFVWAADDGPMTMHIEDTDVHQPAAAFGQNN